MQKNPEAKACQTFSIGVIAVASSFSAVSLLFLVLSVATSNWDAVTFNFNLVNTSVMQSASSYYGSPKLLYSDAESTTLTGMILLTSNSTGYCLLNLYSSLWSLCDRVNTEDALNADYDTYCKNFSFLITNNSCFDYISGYTNARDILDATENTAESQIMRIFVIFSNSIEHEKASRMTRRPQIEECPQCTCYNLVKTPEQFCTDTYRTVSIGWSVATSWVSAFLYLASSVAWFYLTRRVRIDKSKSMV
uniref:PBPe domain-containing protein n=1 Tax=Macrostomum lignano TaxID=282301 RepID=A0A1I8G7P1_9PLAT